ncbi:hypothetical protein T484DRAFT_1846538, partial [Baffinella frigidus]
VDALKGLSLKKGALPSLLTLHLRRFDYDYQTSRRVKVNDRQEAPLVLDMAPFLSSPDSPWLPPEGTA